jgi:hypothetical protein
MSRGLGRVQRLILDYLDDKAKESQVTKFQTVEAYADTTEISRKLSIRSDIVCQAIDSLIIQNRIRMYPNGRRRDRFYGSLVLPSLLEEEVLSTATRSLLKKQE